MGYRCEILADSVSPLGVRLTTMEVTSPRIILAEVNTHRMLSQNSASSRAIPTDRQLERVLQDPFVPDYWGRLQPGMQAEEEIAESDHQKAVEVWLAARDDAVARAKALLKLEVHKQTVNRLLEPFMWHTAIITATDWGNFFGLRDNPMAQPEIRTIAHMMRQAYESHSPMLVESGGWHLPLIQPDEHNRPELINDLPKISAGRCARVSYLTHDGRRDPAADIKLYKRLVRDGHMSPLEHVATPMCDNRAARYGNFVGWKQLRKFIPHEDDFSARPQE